MAKREKTPPSKPSNAYLISFGDTMTAMLAFFIVLNTMAKEQTGANLHAGTGSFVSAISSMGLPGSFTGDKSKNIQQMNHSSPKYVVNDNGEISEDNSGDGPDDEDNGLRVLDRQMENLQRMMTEFEQQFDVSQATDESSSVVFDLFDRIGKPGSLLPDDARKVIVRSLAVLTRPGYRLEFRVWAPTPSKTAMARITKLAYALKEEIRREFPMLDKRPGAIRASSSLWAYSDDRRPVMSIIVVKD